MLIKICIVFIILIIIYKYVTIYSKSITYLTKNELKDLYSNTKYLKTFNKNNIIARKIDNHNIKKFYFQNCLDFDHKTKQNINRIMDYMCEKYSNNYFNNWKFGLVTEKIELGLPHTHRDVIILTKNILSNNLEFLCRLFTHERTHVLQRKYPKKFEILYTKYWNFINVSKIYNFEKFKEETRINPDGLDLKWIFCYKEIYILPLSIFKDSNFTNCENIGIYLEKTNNIFLIPDNPIIKPLSKCNEYTNFFKISSNNYHPNELSAEYFSDYISNKLGYTIQYNDLGYNKFKLWYKVHFNT